MVTGNPLYSLHSTSGRAARTGTHAELPRSPVLDLVLYAVRIDKLPVVLGSIAGGLIAIWLTPRRSSLPLVLLASLLFVFIAEGAAGASVVDRYMIGSAVVMLVLCALAVGGWTMIEPGTVLRRAWMAGAAVLVIYGTVSAATTLALRELAHDAAPTTRTSTRGSARLCTARR